MNESEPKEIRGTISDPVSGRSIVSALGSRLGSSVAVSVGAVVVVVEVAGVVSGTSAGADWRVMVREVVVLQLPFVVTT